MLKMLLLLYILGELRLAINKYFIIFKTIYYEKENLYVFVYDCF